MATYRSYLKAQK